MTRGSQRDRRRIAARPNTTTSTIREENAVHDAKVDMDKEPAEENSVERPRTGQREAKQILGPDKPTASTTQSLEIASRGTSPFHFRGSPGPRFGSHQWNMEVIAESGRRRRVEMERENLLMQERLLRVRHHVEGEPRSDVARGFTERMIREAVAAVRLQSDRAPTLPETAKRLHTSESTLRRAMRDLEMGHWPPAPPED